MPSPTKIMLLVTTAVGTALGLTGMSGGAAPPRPEPRAEVDDASRELEALFAELDRAWNPRVRERALARVRSSKDRLGPPLLRILALPQHERLEDAIGLAVGLELADARELLAALAETAPAALRPLAMQGAARLEPWPPEALSAFLQSADAAMRAAAVPLAAAGPDVLVRDLVMMLDDPDETVRKAVHAALPRQLPAPARAELRAMAAQTTGDMQLAAVRALGRVTLDHDSEAMLCTLVGNADNPVRLAALDALAEKPGRLRDPRTVWALATALRPDPLEQARAFWCLERTGSYTAEAIDAVLPSIEHVLPRFFAARCLVNSGDRSGALALLEMLERDDWQEDLAGLPVDEDALRVGLRTILARVCNTGPDAGVEVWRERLQAVKALSPTRLEPVDLDPHGG